MLQFLRQTLASLLGTLLALLLATVLGTTALFILIAAIAAQQETRDPRLRDNTILVFDLSVEIRDAEIPLSLADNLTGSTPAVLTLRQVVDAIERATWDERIVGLLIDGSQGGGLAGYASLAEVRAALEQFREAGKQILAYDVDLTQREYYLASVAERILLNPIGAVEFNGFSAEQLFLAGALEKFGIGVQVVRVGDYKSAVEPFVRQDLSPENRQQLTDLLEALWQEFLATVSSQRDLTSADLQAIADTQGLLLPSDATAAKLVDDLAHFDEVAAELRQLTQEDEDPDDGSRFRRIDLATYSQKPAESANLRTSRNKIAVLYAEGAIVSGDGGPEEVGSDRFSRQIRRLREDEAVKAIVLRINSPGGSATASDVILRELKLASEEKPLIVSMGDVAASGGYWLATGASYIFAEASTITGSIGVFGLLFNVEDLAQDNGVTWDAVSTAALADLYTASRPQTPAELAVLQRVVNRIYELFINTVAEARSLSRSEVVAIAQGRVWVGQEAERVGLVDEIGGLGAAIAHAAEAADLGDDWEVQDDREPPTLEERLLRSLPLGVRSFLQEAMPRSRWQAPEPLRQQAETLRQDLEGLGPLRDPRGIYMYWPFSLHSR